MIAIMKNICKFMGEKKTRGYFQNVNHGDSGIMNIFNFSCFSVFFTFSIINKGYIYNLKSSDMLQVLRFLTMPFS